ncbi:nucleoside hydrolase [Devosia sp.]|uniref:nucleoside hydrolase n=1 Tax=Devosia sp. TaxID=1871048 RepID=UPI003A8FFD5A
MALKVIFDTDPGIDDAMALLAIVRHSGIALRGVTTVFGNGAIDTVTHNALYLKELFGFDAPVAKGAGKPLVGEADPPPVFVHGDNALGDIAIPEVSATVDPRSAHQLIIDLVRAEPGEITLIAVGRMTNLALALQQDPEIASLVKEVVVMGGAYGRNGHSGNVTPVAEANIWGDASAADIVFGASWPLTIVGLDVTEETVMTAADVDGLAAEGGADGEFVRDVSAHYQKFYNARLGFDGFFVHDWSAVAYALQPDLYTVERGQLGVITAGEAIGQTIIGDTRQGRAEQQICVAVDGPAVTQMYRDAVLGRL